MIEMLLITDTPLFCETLQRALAEEGIQITGCAASVEDALSLMGSDPPHVVLIDVRVPRGRAIVSEISKEARATPILALGGDGSDAEVIEWAEAGVSWHLSRRAPLVEVVRAVEAVLEKEFPCSPRIAKALLDSVRRNGVRPSSTVSSTLTPREGEVIELTRQGLSRKEIAVKLCIEETTVKNHLHHVYEKLHVHGKREVLAQSPDAESGASKVLG